MSAEPGTWTAVVRVRASSERTAEMLERALRPEADREVPRARARLSRPSAREVELDVTARDGGAMRAALNTYLGWVALSAATLRSAAPESPR
ncbi:MAG TPA: KEOPS complex subunit Pcc1 [Thermoplasmata archaeon]|nr:KEOPS complex subunit Pcc1 [Thermoplasmata archaeon]